MVARARAGATKARASILPRACVPVVYFPVLIHAVRFLPLQASVTHCFYVVPGWLVPGVASIVKLPEDKTSQ